MFKCSHTKKNYHFFQYAPLFALFFPRIKFKYQVFRGALYLNKEKNMIVNMGIIDRILRVILATTVGVLVFLKILTGIPAIVLGVLACVFLLTSLIGFCPLYVPFKISTNKK